MANAQNPSEKVLNFRKIKAFERELDEVMELIDIPEIKRKLVEIEDKCNSNPTEINRAKLGIIYHETALNLSFFAKSEYKGYAKKSIEVLTELKDTVTITPELLPFVASYQASALALMGAETKKLNLIEKSFRLFDDAISKYASISYLPEFMRGSVAENLPWFYFRKRKLAKRDFESILFKYHKNPEYANWKVISFTYWAWAKQHQKQKDRAQALGYLEKAVVLDPNYKAGRQRAEELMEKMMT